MVAERSVHERDDKQQHARREIDGDREPGAVYGVGGAAPQAPGGASRTPPDRWAVPFEARRRRAGDERLRLFRRSLHEPSSLGDA